ncbi:hypothetical protein SDD30_15090 [Moorella naiadis]
MKTIDIINELLELPTEEDIICRLKELKELNKQDSGDTHSKEETHYV